MISKDAKITIELLAQKSSMSKSAMMHTVNRLKDEGRIKRIGGPKRIWRSQDLDPNIGPTYRHSYYL